MAVPAIEIARWNNPANKCDLFRKKGDEYYIAASAARYLVSNVADSTVSRSTRLFYKMY
jgi:hypothetical protein